MSCDVGEVTERLENELCSNLSVTSPTSQLILQPFRRFIYVTAHSATLPLLHVRYSSFSNPSFASPTSPALHLRHLPSSPWHKAKHCHFCSGTTMMATIFWTGPSQVMKQGLHTLSQKPSSRQCTGVTLDVPAR